jgi:hypothetical protein
MKESSVFVGVLFILQCKCNGQADSRKSARAAAAMVGMTGRKAAPEAAMISPASMECGGGDRGDTSLEAASASFSRVVASAARSTAVIFVATASVSAAAAAMSVASASVSTAAAVWRRR